MKNTSVTLLMPILCLIAFVITFIFSDYNLAVAAIVFVCMVILFIISRDKRSTENHAKRALLFMAIFDLMLLITSLIYLWYLNANYYEFSTSNGYDGAQYVYWARQLYENGILNFNYGIIALSEKGIVYFYAFILTLFGDNLYSLVIINTFLAVLTGIMVYKIGGRFLSEKTAKMAAIFMCLLPEGLMWVGEMRKDTLATFLCTSILLFYYKIFQDDNRKYFWLVMLFIVFLFFVRGTLGGVMILLGIIFAFQSKYKLFKLLPQITIIILMLLLFFSRISKEIIAKGTFPIQKLIVGDVIGPGGELLGGGGSEINYADGQGKSIVYNLTGSLSIKNIYILPLRVALYYLAPFPPIRIRDNSDYLCNPSTWLVISMLPFMILGLIKFIKKKAPEYKFIYLSFLVLATAMAFSGSWVHERYRLFTMPMFFLMSSYALEKLNKRQRLQMFLFMPLMFGFLFVMYFIIKIFI